MEEYIVFYPQLEQICLESQALSQLTLQVHCEMTIKTLKTFPTTKLPQ